MLDEINKYYDLARETLLKYGSPLSLVAIDVEKLKSASTKEQEDALVWIRAFVDVRVRRVNHVRSLVPESQWDAYEALGAEGLWEQEQLNDAIKVLRDDW